MTRLHKLGRFLTIGNAEPQRTGKRRARLGHQQSSLRCSPRLEQLESRVTPSILGTFELDGNATTGVLGTSGSTTTSHDWDQVFADAGSPAIHTSGTFTRGPTTQALAGTFVSDEVNASDDIYTGGSTKDTLPVSGWLFKTGKPQDKDEITDAYATAYTDPGSGHLVLYAGLDRFSNSGDSTAGFWFFQNQIGKSTTGTVSGSGAPFTGTHQDGDILLVSDFSVGGSVSTISIYRWTGNDATGSLVNVTNLGNPNTFAIVNSAPVSVPWSYTDKSGFKQPQAGEFLEEGVDLTALNIQGCFSSFLAETRSSTSPTATLSDFVIGGFPLCSLAAPQFTGLSKFDTFTHQGDLVTYPLTVQNTGGMPLYIQSVSDTLLGNIVVNHTLQAPTAPVTSITSAFNFSQSLAPGASLTILVSRPVQATDPDPTPDTVTFVGTDDLAGTADPITTSVSNSVNLFQPSVSMTETASTTAAAAGTPITYTYTIHNTSSSDSPNLVLNSANQGTGDPDTFTSSLFGDIEADAVHALAGNNTATTASLAPGASFSFTETHVLSASDPTPLTDTTNAIFSLAQNLGAFPNQIHSNTTTATVRRVNAEISIAGSGVNEINNPHTFTVTVNQDLGDGNGFVPAANEPVTVTLTNTNGSTTSPTTFNVTTNASGQASVTFTSATAGEVIGNASTTFTVEGVTLTRATGDSHVGDSGPVTKFFEDANISIAASGFNEINNPHTFTVTVLQNAGDGKGYVAAANEPVTVTLTNTNGSTTSPTTFNVTTNASGQASVTFTSATAGEVIGNASTTFTLNGVTLTRATGDTHVGDSGPVTKFFEDANISITGSGVNEINNPHTFTVTVLENVGDGKGYVAAANEPVTVTLTNTNGSTTSPTTFNVTTNASGQASVTFTSATAGEVIGNASTTFTLNGVTLTRATGDTHGGDSGPVTKFFEDANISIAPNATNAVGQPHTFTVTVLENAGDGNGYVAAANEPVTVALTSTNGAAAVPSTPLTGTTNASGQFQVTFTSATAGQVIGNASTSFTLNGVTLTRATGDSHGGDSGPATKTFVDERISIAPNATNAVGQPHTFTVTVLENLGDGNGFVVPVSGQAVTVTLTSTNGAAAVPSTPLTGNTNSSGQFQVTFTSATAGQVSGNATTSFTVNSVTETRSTGDGQSGDSGPAVKTFVDEQISIAASGVNEVNNPHTFTVTVLKNIGDGNGFVVPVASQAVTVTLTNTNGSTTSPTTFNVTTNASGQASVTFTSATAGTVIGNASTSFTVNNATETRSTGDSQSGDSGPVTKVFEDAQISISPNATNGLTEPHTFTVTVRENAGAGTGYVVAANVPVTVTLTGQNGAVPIAETPLSGTTNASGQFQVTFTSDSAGQVLGNASTTFTLNGVTLTRATGDGKGEVGFVDSGPATKTFVAGKILWKKVDGFGNPLGGATFLVTATQGTAAGLSPTSVTVVDNGSFDVNKTNGLFELDAFQSFGGSNLTGLALGTYTIQEITAPPGYTLDPRVLTVTLTQSSLTGDVTATPFVDTLPNLNIVKTVTANQTVIHPGGTASYTITVSNPNPTGGTAGAATNVVLTDQLPDASQLTWTVTNFTGFTAASISSSGVLTATEASMPGGGSASVVISATVPANFFGNVGAPNGDGVPSSLFEIDGNATVDTSGGHDWNQVYADNTANPKTNTAGAIASSFVTDETTNDGIYTGGSTKDTLPISGWLFKTGKPQDKDEISHAAAALYRDPSTNDVILYTMVDRFSNSGDSTMGFWFFVNPISKSTTGTVSGSGAPFVGSHTTGDLLLVSDFSIGGSVSTITVYKWVGNDATGSLQLVGTTTSTIAEVNSGNPGVAWPFTDKAGLHQPQAGEFLEEGVNLSGLGLNPCFASFLAETRSSTTPTATLSDFVIGSFQTCDVMLPNQASVSASNFNNGQPITSSTVVIDLNDGMPQLAASVNSGAAAASLTEVQLQALLPQAIAIWRAAGIDPATLSNLRNYAIQIANLPGGELGWETPGHIWIDATAQGWGWSTGSTPEPGEMDLLTVLTHEVGHVLGFGDHLGGNDIMTTYLNPGMRRLPEALPGSSSGVAQAATVDGSTASAASTPSFSALSQAGLALTLGNEEDDTADAGLVSTSHDPLATAVHSTTLVTVAAKVAAQQLVTATIQSADAVPVMASPAGPVPADAIVLSVPGAEFAPAPEGVYSSMWQSSGEEAVLIGGLGTDLQIGGEGRDVLLGGIGGDSPEHASGSFVDLHRAWTTESDACFADGSWMADGTGQDVVVPASVASSAGPVLETAAAAVAALALLGGHWAEPRATTEERTRRRLLR
jgi:hypothetical protein